MTEGHSVITAMQGAQEGWRKQVSFEDVKAHKEVERVAPFVSAENLFDMLKGLSAEDQVLLMYSLDLSSLKSKVELIRFMFQTQATPLLTYGPSLYRQSDMGACEDREGLFYTLTQKTICPLLLDSASNSPANTKKEILKRFHNLLCTGSDGATRGAVFMECLKSQNYEWIEVAAPVTFSVNYFSPVCQDLLPCSEELFLKYLPLFKQAFGVAVGSLQLLNNQYEDLFANVLHG